MATTHRNRISRMGMEALRQGVEGVSIEKNEVPQTELAQDGPVSCLAAEPSTPSPKFSRSWSFVAPAEDRMVSLSEVKGKKKSNFKIDVKRAMDRSWSFTKTTRSPPPDAGNSHILDMLTPDDRREVELEMAESDLLTPRQPSPMASIHEDEDHDEEEEEDHESSKSTESDAAEEMVEPVKAYKVKALSRTLVPASEPSEQEWLLLSNLDRVVNPTFSSVIHYYSNVITEGRSFADAMKGLKESLAKTLVDFYPLAGRLSLREDGKVDLRCNNAGAIWVEAAVDEDLKDIGGPKPNHRLSGFDVARVGPGPLYIPDQVTDMPVLIIQATRFKCGTVAIATSWHHTAADGFSGTHFMKSWAEVALGKPISVPPSHSRENLRPRNPPNPTLVNGYSTTSLEDLSFDGIEVNTSEPAQLEKFDLDKEAIADLKTQANLEPPPYTPRPYTSAESISGHLWRQMTKARATANSYTAATAKEQTTKFFMFVDGRKRLRLPSGFFGNVVCSACAVAKEADILNNHLTYAASLIRIATRNTTEEYFRSLIDWVELQGMASSKSEHVNSLGHDVAATFWTFFPLYEIEFGFGRPLFAARNSPPRPLIDGIAMMPKADGKGMTALLNLHADRMSKLQRQISFATVFH